MDQFEKKLANKAKRKESKKVIQKWDADTKGKKKGGLKACPGFVDHTGRKKAELTVPCPTCKRHFCSQECLDSHKDFCEWKLHYSKTGDEKPLLDLCHKVFSTYFDAEGHVFPQWVEKHGLGKNTSFYGLHTLRWRYPRLDEACRLLKKHDRDFYDEIGNKYGGLIFW